MIDCHLDKFKMPSQCHPGRKCPGPCQGVLMHFCLRILLMPKAISGLFIKCARTSLERRRFTKTWEVSSNIYSIILEFQQPQNHQFNAFQEWQGCKVGTGSMGTLFWNFAIFNNILISYIFTLWPRNSTYILLTRYTGENKKQPTNQTNKKPKQV